LKGLKTENVQMLDKLQVECQFARPSTIRSQRSCPSWDLHNLAWLSATWTMLPMQDNLLDTLLSTTRASRTISLEHDQSTEHDSSGIIREVVLTGFWV